MGYATLEELKGYLGIALTEQQDDVLLASLLEVASAKIDADTRTTFRAEDDATRYFDGGAIRGDTLRLDAHLLSVTSIVNGDGVTIAGGDVIGLPRNEGRYHSLRLRASTIPRWWAGEEIAVTGKWGFSTEPPADIVQACIRLATYLYRQKDNTVDLDRAVVSAGGTLLPATLPRDIEQYLAPYMPGKL